MKVGIVACLLTHASDGTFVRWPAWPGPDRAHVTVAFRRAVLRLFVRRAVCEEEQAPRSLHRPHWGFDAHTGAGVPEDDCAFTLRLARSCARKPVALARMPYDPAIESVTYRSAKPDGPTAGTEQVDPLEFLPSLVTHLPDPPPVMQRYDGGYVNQTPGRAAAAPGHRRGRATHT
ncbi:MAG TPA: transposase [Gemmatimonadales bacterium]|nr:transposase [Gemmatimonadales bacterium]